MSKLLTPADSEGTVCVRKRVILELVANDGDLPPKLDLTRIEDFDPSKEPQGPDMGTLLGLKPAEGAEDLAIEAPPPQLDLTQALEGKTDALLEAMRSEANAPGTAPAITSVSVHGGSTRVTEAGGAPSAPKRAPEPEPVEEIPPTPMESLKRFSEQISVAKELVPAAYPFSVRVDGPLQPEEKERLLDLLNRENLGIRPMDLEPQLEEGRVLIPRVSEYAGVLIVQALRSSQAQIRIGPADEIFSTEDTRADSDEQIAPHLNPPPSTTYDTAHAAERIPVTPEAKLPELGPYVVVDIVTASAALSVQAVEAVRSTEYNDMIEALQRELRFKAWRKGATAVLNFSVQLNLLSLPSRYRVLVTGSAVRAVTAEPRS